jgi:Ca2+-transporting ATPase
MMATYHREDDRLLVAVKGAPEAVLRAATHERRGDTTAGLDEARRGWWQDRVDGLAADGLRVLGLAQKRANSSEDDPYQGLELLGLIGLHDPPRPAVAEAIARARHAGIRVAMVTGDQPATAAAIAREVGIGSGDDPKVATGDALDEGFEPGAGLGAASVFARVTPEQKLRLVSLLQEQADVVGMTGDGVNDAPALKKADIGIAMGRRGTEVARETGDIVLEDDAFETIVMAVGQGRSIFRNIRKFVVFLLSGNLGQILAVSAAAVASAPLPLRPLQILFLNLLLDVFPALALGLGRDDPEAMRRPPRDPREPILTRSHWLTIGGFGVALGGSVLGAFAGALGHGSDLEAAVTVAFLAYALARLWHVFNMRSLGSGLLANEVVRNPYVWLSFAVCLALLAVALFVPVLSELLSLSALDRTEWALALVGSLVPLGLGQAGLGLMARRRGWTDR